MPKAITEEYIIGHNFHFYLGRQAQDPKEENLSDARQSPREPLAAHSRPSSPAPGEERKARPQRPRFCALRLGRLRDRRSRQPFRDGRYTCSWTLDQIEEYLAAPRDRKAG